MEKRKVPHSPNVFGDEKKKKKVSLTIKWNNIKINQHAYMRMHDKSRRKQQVCMLQVFRKG